MVHPEILLTQGRAQYSDKKEVAEYVGVASFRNYYEYKRTGNKTLDLIHCPVSEETIKSNRLLDIRDGVYSLLIRGDKRRNKMAIGFNQTKGSAQKKKSKTYNFSNKEDHHIRLVGDLLPRYVYWIKGENNKNIPMECLLIETQKL